MNRGGYYDPCMQVGSKIDPCMQAGSNAELSGTEREKEENEQCETIKGPTL